MKKIYLLCFILFVSALRAQEKVDLSIHFLSNDQIGDVNFDRDPFMEYAKVFTSNLSGFFETSDEKKDVVVLLTLSKDKQPEISVYARPALDKKTSDQLIKKLKAAGKIKTKLVPYSLLFVAKLNGGAENQEETFVPEVILPGDAEKEEMKNADLAGKIKLIKKWSREYAIPVLAAFENSVEEKFEGVRAIGKTMSAANFDKPVDVLALTDKNPSYWRALAEMSPGNLLIPISKVALHIANGEFDYAQNYLDVISIFSDDKSTSHYFAQEFSWRLNMFNNELNTKIQKGLDLHDLSDHEGAIKLYESVLSVYPQSAWAQYEIYFSRNTQKVLKDTSALNDRTDWDEAKKGIYASNPMYPMDIRASNGKEGFLLFRRQSISTLFKDDKNLLEDLIQYADIAFDLENYALSAHMHWFMLSSLPKEKYDNRNLLEYFLYALDKLGDKTMAENFNGDHPEEFKKIELEKKEIMENNPLYKSFKN